MANHKSAKKRHRQSLERNERNRSFRTRMRGAIKAARAEIDEGKASLESPTIKAAIRALTRAGQKGILHKSAASRRVSRLTRAVNGSPTGSN